MNSKKISRVNRMVIGGFFLMAVASLACANGLHQWQEANDIITLSLPNSEQLAQLSPDVRIFKVLLEFAKNIITLKG